VNVEDQDGNALNTLRYGVFGESADGQTLSGYSMGGAVDIGALAGTYTLRVYVMGGGYTSDYEKPVTVTLADGGTETVTLTVYETPASLGGTVTDADDAAVRIQQRTTRVSRINRGGVLDHIVDQASVPSAKRPPDGADDARCYGRMQAEGTPQRYGDLSGDCDSGSF
jgi:hypothetical protein